ncbi:MAG: GH79, partial [uncultured Solirubrobacteraceae bacterium]
MLRVVVVALVACGLLAADVRAATVSVDPTRFGQRVPRSFFGLSVEWDSLVPYAGRDGRRAAALERLLAPIARSQGGLSLRVGGNSGDSAWWNPEGRRKPRTVLHDVTPRTLDAANAVSGALGRGPVTLGLNLALRDPANARTLVDEARRRFELDAVELGNEPDLYTAAKTFRVPGAVHRRVRKHARYGPAAYGRDVARYMAALKDGPRFSVGGFARPFWWSSLPGLLDRWQDRAGILAVHMYALPYCDAKPPPASWLMTREASRGLAAKIRPIARLARHRGLSLR